MSKLSEAIKPYRESNGMVSLYKNPGDHSTDNGSLFSTEYLMILSKQPDATPNEVLSEFRQIYLMSFDLYKEPGLLMRYPKDVDGDNSHDNYRAIAALSPTHAQLILNYGRKNVFCWNTKNPGVYDPKFCFDRFPGFMAVLMAGAGEPVPWAEQFSFFLSCFGILLDKRETSPIILMWVSIKAVEGKGWIMDLGIAIWRMIAMRKYPGGLREVMCAYFKDPEHPFRHFSRTDFL